MEKLLPEFQNIVEAFSRPGIGMRDMVERIVTRCQELALRRPEMNSIEILKAYHGEGDSGSGFQAVLEAYEKKRFQPVKRVVRCRLYEASNGQFFCRTDAYGESLDAANFKWHGDIFEREV